MKKRFALFAVLVLLFSAVLPAATYDLSDIPEGMKFSVYFEKVHEHDKALEFIYDPDERGEAKITMSFMEDHEGIKLELQPVRKIAFLSDPSFAGIDGKASIKIEKDGFETLSMMKAPAWRDTFLLIGKDWERLYELLDGDGDITITVSGRDETGADMDKSCVFWQNGVSFADIAEEALGGTFSLDWLELEDMIMLSMLERKGHVFGTGDIYQPVLDIFFTSDWLTVSSYGYGDIWMNSSLDFHNAAGSWENHAMTASEKEGYRNAFQSIDSAEWRKTGEEYWSPLHPGNTAEEIRDFLEALDTEGNVELLLKGRSLEDGSEFETVSTCFPAPGLLTFFREMADESDWPALKLFYFYD